MSTLKLTPAEPHEVEFVNEPPVELPPGRTVAVDIARRGIQQDYPVDIYSVYAALYGTHASKDGGKQFFIGGCLAPRQVVPMWVSSPVGTSDKAVVWTQETFLQLTQWSAVTRKGVLRLASNEFGPDGKPLPRDQDFDALEYLHGDERFKTRQPHEDLLVAPGGRVRLNVREKFPIIAPFLNPRSGDAHPQRVVNPMSAQAWLDHFGNAQVFGSEHVNMVSGSVEQPQSKPDFKLVAMDLDDSADAQELYDPIHDRMTRCVELPEIPITLEFAEFIMAAVSGNDPDNTTSNAWPRLMAGVCQYLSELEIGIPKRIGFAWLDHIDIAQGAPMSCTWRERTYNIAHSVAYRRLYMPKKGQSEFKRNEVRGMDAVDKFAAFQNGSFEPDLATARP